MSTLKTDKIQGVTDVNVVEIPIGVTGKFLADLTDGDYDVDLRLRDVIIKGSWFDARAYGTLGTQAAIVAALADIGADERTLYITPGIWSITSDLSIPSNVNLKFERGAIFQIATGVTVTINGGVEAGTYQIFSQVGTASVDMTATTNTQVEGKWWGASTNISANMPGILNTFLSGRYSLGSVDTPYAQFMVNPTLTTLGTGWHAFSDWSILDDATTTGQGYAAFDARPTMNNTNAQDHFVGFQSRPIFNGAGDLSTYYAPMISNGTHTGAGTVVNYKGLWITNPGGAGVITNCYGLYISGINRGGTLNYSIYSEGGNNYLGGKLFVNQAMGLMTVNPQAIFDLTTTKLKTENQGIYAYLGKSTESTNYAALQLATYGGVTQPNRIWTFQTIESGVASTGTIALQHNGGRVIIGGTAATSKFQVVGLPQYANNAAAVAAGLTAGAFYRNGSDPDLVCVVH